MAFFRNTTVNLLNLHYGVHWLALSGGGAFFGAYMLRAGVPAPIVLGALALILVFRFTIRPFIVAAAARFGLKPLVIAGVLIGSLQFPLLAEIHGADWRLIALCAVAAAGDTVYWTSYHAYFASLGDAEHRGHQIGAREAIAAVVGVIAPLMTGWTLAIFGPRVAFGATAAIVVLSALPLFGTPNVTIARSAPGAFRAAIPGVLMFAADGWMASAVILAWSIALFQSLGESFTAFGGAMALAALAGAATGLLLGRSIDLGHGGRAVWLAAGSMVLVAGLRAASYGNPAFAVVANAAGALIPALYTPTLMTAVYNQAKASPCVLRFHVATEGGWDAGGAAGCMAGAGLLWAGASMSWVILLALAGAAASFALLRRYYGRIDAADRGLARVDTRPTAA